MPSDSKNFPDNGGAGLGAYLPSDNSDAPVPPLLGGAAPMPPPLDRRSSIPRKAGSPLFSIPKNARMKTTPKGAKDHSTPLPPLGRNSSSPEVLNDQFRLHGGRRAEGQLLVPPGAGGQERGGLLVGGGQQDGKPPPETPGMDPIPNEPEEVSKLSFLDNLNFGGGSALKWRDGPPPSTDFKVGYYTLL